MRIKLGKNKQKELIILAKNNQSWKELAKRLKINAHYLAIELKNEKTLISDKVYSKLKDIAKIDFDNYILEKLDNDWGKSKGGRNSPKNKKHLSTIEESENLAELIGIILGDGHVEHNKNGNYSIRIAGHLSHDFNFLSVFASKLMNDIFKEKGQMKASKKYNTAWLCIYGRNIVEFIISKGLKSGNKKKNNQGIPDWIKKNKCYLRVCIRGLIDTDGSVHLISKENRNLRINFTNYSSKLLKDTKEGLEILGIKSSKIIKDKQIFITKKEDVKKYMNEIGFSNEKHLKRIKRLGS